MFTHHLRIAACGFVLAWATSPLTSSAQAQDVASFYRGRTVQAVVGYPAGSTFELYLRMFARHVGKHIPGNPTVVIQHMPGAGSLTATSHLANVAPKDGSVFGMPISKLLMRCANAKSLLARPDQHQAQPLMLWCSRNCSA